MGLFFSPHRVSHKVGVPGRWNHKFICYVQNWRYSWPNETIKLVKSTVSEVGYTVALTELCTYFIKQTAERDKFFGFGKWALSVHNILKHLLDFTKNVFHIRLCFRCTKLVWFINLLVTGFAAFTNRTRTKFSNVVANDCISAIKLM